MTIERQFSATLEGEIPAQKIDMVNPALLSIELRQALDDEQKA